MNSYSIYRIRAAHHAGRALATLTLMVAALAVAKPADRARLYTQPDGSAGGIKGRVVSPIAPIEQVLAMPTDEPRFVYEGRVTGTSRRSFEFSGLPMRKYDLVVIYENSFYEGCLLQRGDDTLTATDRQKISASVQKSEPFFPKKFIHRVEGTTGRGNTARCICTYLRDRKSEEHSATEFRRTFKLLLLKDVGPGWQIVRARDLYPIWAKPSQAQPKHTFSKKLSQVRVTRYVKDLGDINLSQ